MDDLKRVKIGALELYARANGASGNTDHFIIDEVQRVYYWDEITALNPSTFVDVGAQIGAYSAYAALCYPTARIIGIEPHKGNYGLATLNTSDYPNVEIWHGYIGYTQKAALLIDPDNVGGHRMGDSVPDGWQTQKAPPRYSLEDVTWEYGLGRIDVLKLDCEGAEYEILPLVTPQLARCIVGEYHGTLDEFVSACGTHLSEHYQFSAYAVHPHIGMFLALPKDGTP